MSQSITRECMICMEHKHTFRCKTCTMECCLSCLFQVIQHRSLQCPQCRSPWEIYDGVSGETTGELVSVHGSVLGNIVDPICKLQLGCVPKLSISLDPFFTTCKIEGNKIKSWLNTIARLHKYCQLFNDQDKYEIAIQTEVGSPYLNYWIITKKQETVHKELGHGITKSWRHLAEVSQLDLYALTLQYDLEKSIVWIISDRTAQSQCSKFRYRCIKCNKIFSLVNEFESHLHGANACNGCLDSFSGMPTSTVPIATMSTVTRKPTLFNRIRRMVTNTNNHIHQNQNHHNHHNHQNQGFIFEHP